MSVLKTIISLSLCFLSLKLTETSRNPICVGKDCDKIFEDYLKEFDIYVADNATKEVYRTQFMVNIREINRFNAQPNKTYVKGINKFTCFNFEVLKQHVLGYVPPMQFIVYASPINFADSICSIKSFDWRAKGCVSPIKDQGTCGSCFAFSAIAAIESQILIKYKTNVSLSEQYAMDCLYDYWKLNGDACNGGQPGYIYYMAANNEGLPSTTSVPYLGRDTDVCPKNVSIESLAAIESFRSFSMFTEKQIACQLAKNGPISIAMHASISFLQYTKGIYNDIDDCPDDAIPNHSILLVGFGYDALTKMEYFIAKNSWGTKWGENGYIRMKKGVNLCNLRILPQQPYF